MGLHERNIAFVKKILMQHYLRKFYGYHLSRTVALLQGLFGTPIFIFRN